MKLRKRLATQPPGYAFTLGRVLAIYIGLMLGLLLAALDQTIVATALPQVVTSLGGLTKYAWVFTAYMLASTVSIPLYGRLGDLYGRRPLLVIAIVLLLVGSALCGIAQTMNQLIVFRAIQGLGAGGLFPLSLAVIGSIVPPRERGRWQGMNGALFGAASIFGPVAGGFIIDNASWRWVFFINLPVGGLALIVILLTMPPRATRAQHEIDWLGAGLLALGTAALLLALAWGGRAYAWTDVHVIGGFAVSLVTLVLFGVVEMRTSEPILPFAVFRTPIVTASLACFAIAGLVMFALLTYGPLFVQGVLGRSAASSGLVLTPLMLTASLSAMVSGYLVTRTGHYRWNVLLGPLVLALGTGLLWQMDSQTTDRQVAIDMAIAGIGIGSMMQVFMVAVQNSVPRPLFGSATALTQFLRQMGATVGLALMGLIVNQGLPSGTIVSESVGIHRLSPALRDALASAIRPVFFTSMVFSLVMWFLAAVWVRKIPMERPDEVVAVSEPVLVVPTLATPD